MEKQFIASYDFGTGGVKAVLIGLDCKVEAYATAYYPLLSPQSGWAEQDPDAYWQAVCNATRQTVEKAGIRPEQVVGVVFGTMWKGIIPLDAEDHVLHNCIIWLDARADKQAEELNARLPEGGYCAQDYWAKLLWLRETHPEIYDKTACILENNSYLKFKATGKKGVDLTNCLVTSSKPALKAEYERIMHAAGVDLSLFPRELMPWESIGGLTAEAAGQMGLSKDTPVFGGCGDIPAIAIGSGSSGMGAGHIYLGSSGWLGVTVPERVTGVGECYQTLDREKEILLYVLQSAGMSFDWAIRQFYHAEWEQYGRDVYDLVNAEMDTVPAGSCNLLATPWLHGERPPLSDKARGVFINMDANHERKHFVHAMLESVCFMLRLKLEAYRRETWQDVNTLRVVGGGTCTHKWMQMMADILNVVIEVPPNARHAGAIGTAYCALIGLGVCKNFEDANRLVGIESRYVPNPENQELYERQFGIFRRLYPALKDVFQAMN